MGVWKVKLLNMMLKIEFKNIKMPYGLIRYIKGHHIHLFSSFNSSFEKSYNGYANERNLLVSISLV